MEKIIVSCKLITPLFMYGANNIPDNNTPEIRATSIKGLLRFWWRTFNYFENPDSLKKNENKIFGSTDKRSPINIKVNDNCEKLDTKIIDETKYLFYSLEIRKQVNGNKVKKLKTLKTYKYPTKEQSFDIEFSYTNRDKNEKREIFKEHYVKALKLMQVLGGLGSRNRRGAGNFVITNVEVVNDSNFSKELKKELIIDTKVDKYENQLIKFLNSLIESKKLVNTGKYPNILGTRFSIYKHKNEFNSWKEALKKINDVYKNFRKNAEWKKNNFKHEALAVFGLPLSYGKNSQTYEFNTIENETILNRLPSPLIFKICEIGENKYIALIIRLSSDLLDNYSEINIRKKGDKNIKKVELRKKKRNLIDIFLENEEFMKLYEH